MSPAELARKGTRFASASSRSLRCSAKASRRPNLTPTPSREAMSTACSTRYTSWSFLRRFPDPPAPAGRRDYPIPLPA